MKIIVYFAAFAFLMSAAFSAEAKNYDHIDKRVSLTPTSVESNVDSLTEYLVRGTKNDKEKARAIAVWIASRVEYDDVKNRKIMQYIETNKGVIPDTGDALITRKGVCLDFAKLFYKMATVAGIESEIVLGYAGGFSENGVILAKHAWNAAKLDGEWYLLDVTWSSDNLKDKNLNEFQYEKDLQIRKKGSVATMHESRRNSFRKEFDEKWFLTPPQEMIKTHFPHYEKFQLLEKPVTEEEFLKRFKR